MRKKILYLPLLLGFSMSSHATPQWTGFHDFYAVNLSAGISPIIRYISQDGDIFNDSDFSMSCSGATCNFAINDKSTLWSRGHVTYQIGDNASAFCLITIYDGSYVGTPEISNATCMNGAFVSKLTKTSDHHFSFAIKR